MTRSTYFIGAAILPAGQFRRALTELQGLNTSRGPWLAQELDSQQLCCRGSRIATPLPAVGLNARASQRSDSRDKRMAG